MSALQNKQKTRKRILPFVTEYRPSVPNLKNILMSKWHLIQNQPLLREVYKDHPYLHSDKGDVCKMYSLEQSFAEGHNFPISTNRSRVLPVNHLYHHPNQCFCEVFEIMDSNLLRECAQRLTETAHFIRDAGVSGGSASSSSASSSASNTHP